MTFDLAVLVWSTGLFALYVGVQSTLYRVEHGVRFALTARDDEPDGNKWNQRANKALRNLIETYPVFVVLAVANLLQPAPDPVVSWAGLVYILARIVYLPLYIFGVVGVRSLVWTVSAIALIVMFFSIAL